MRPPPGCTPPQSFFTSSAQGPSAAYTGEIGKEDINARTAKPVMTCTFFVILM
jgi:hypothetical protein